MESGMSSLRFFYLLYLNLNYIENPKKWLGKEKNDILAKKAKYDQFFDIFDQNVNFSNTSGQNFETILMHNSFLIG